MQPRLQDTILEGNAERLGGEEFEDILTSGVARLLDSDWLIVLAGEVSGRVLASRGSLGAFYSHPGTQVFMLTAFADGSYKDGYGFSNAVRAPKDAVTRNYRGWRCQHEGNRGDRLTWDFSAPNAAAAAPAAAVAAAAAAVAA